MSFHLFKMFKKQNIRFLLYLSDATILIFIWWIMNVKQKERIHFPQKQQS